MLAFSSLYQHGASLFFVLQVNEVEFINAMTMEMVTENKRLSLQRRLEDSDQRRKERLATIIAKQEEKLSKVCMAGCESWSWSWALKGTLCCACSVA